MARPARRGQAGWSLAQVAAEARVSRGVARAAVARGYLPADPLAVTDIVLLRVAAACLGFPDPDADPPARTGRPTTRDTLALRLARAALVDPATGADTTMVLTARTVDIVDRHAGLPDALAAAGSAATLVLPVGLWRALLPREPATTALHLVPDPTSAPASPTAVPVPAQAHPDYQHARAQLASRLDRTSTGQTALNQAILEPVIPERVTLEPADDPFGDQTATPGTLDAGGGREGSEDPFA